MSDRRFSDDEVARIFAKATEVQREQSASLSRSEGMSLEELQAIGREAGISPEMVAQAARLVDQPPPPKPPTVLGITIGVARTVELDRKLTDEEWDQLVVLLRETFEARGKVEAQGSFRQWTNSNLQILLEPTARGHRVRFKTTRGDARGLVSAGVSMVAVSSLLAFIGAITPTVDGPQFIAGLVPVGIIGTALTISGLARLPSWRSKREKQFEAIASHLLRLTDGK